MVNRLAVRADYRQAPGLDSGAPADGEHRFGERFTDARIEIAQLTQGRRLTAGNPHQRLAEATRVRDGDKSPQPDFWTIERFAQTHKSCVHAVERSAGHQPHSQPAGDVRRIVRYWTAPRHDFAAMRRSPLSSSNTEVPERALKPCKVALRR